MKNKKALTQENILVIIVVAFIFFFAYSIAQMGPAPIEFDENNSKEGGLKIELIGDEGDRGFVADAYYGDGAPFSIFRKESPIPCDEATPCECPPEDSFCEEHIYCHKGECSYKKISKIVWHAEVVNVGEAPLEVFLDNVLTEPESTEFNESFSKEIGKSKVLKAYESFTFKTKIKGMDLFPYETGNPTIFTVELHAINLYNGERIPAEGSQTASQTLIIDPTPTEGYTVTLTGEPQK